MSSEDEPSVPTTVDVPVLATFTDPPTKATVDWSSVAWDDVKVDEDGKPERVLGIKLVDLTSKNLRTICSRLLIKGVKNAKKCEMIEKIVKTHSNQQVYMARKAKKNASITRKEVQCTFRLVNILFSDEFAEAFAMLGNSASRTLLDTGMAGDDEHFWSQIQAAFVEPDESYNQLRFVEEDEILGAQDAIDPGKIVSHDWKKLRSLWKGLNAEYKAALTRFTLSGTNESNFYNFCNGKLDSYYLHLNLQVRPNLTDTVQAALPSECALSSEQPPSDGTINSSGSTKKKKPNEVASAIRSLAENMMRDDLVKHKIECMTKEEERRAKEEERRQMESTKEEERRAKEEERRQLESVQMGRKRLFEEWQDIRSNLRLLRAELQDQNLPEDVRNDILNDDAQLRKRKKEVALELGMATI